MQNFKHWFRTVFLYHALYFFHDSQTVRSWIGGRWVLYFSYEDNVQWWERCVRFPRDGEQPLGLRIEAKETYIRN